MKISSLDAVNIALMVGAAILAVIMPFELFLFLYAVLGPLHYLTEISWLHRKRYFVSSAPRYLWPIAMLAALAILTLISRTGGFMPVYSALLLFVFFSAFIIGSLSGFWKRLIGFILAGLIAIGSTFLPFFVTFVAILLPTVVHVFLFTFCFMLSGALKSKSTWGIVAALLFLVLSAGLLFSFGVPGASSVTAYARQAYGSFEAVNITLLALLPVTIEDFRAAVYSSVFGIAVMRFLAFIYTYHYLNWFSKTQVIRWHQVSRQELATILVAWLVSIGIYAYDYRTGLLALYFLSLLHVLLEFPLNHASFVTLGTGIIDKCRSAFRKNPQT